MEKSNAVIAARTEVYIALSKAILAGNLMLLGLIGLLLPPRAASVRHVFTDMNANSNPALPAVTQVVMSLTTPVILGGAGLMALMLITKEIYTPAKTRLWLNVVNLLILLLWGVFCELALMHLPFRVLSGLPLYR